MLGGKEAVAALGKIREAENSDEDGEWMDTILASMLERLAIEDRASAYFRKRDALYYWQAKYEPIPAPRVGSVALLYGHRMRWRVADGGLARISLEFLHDKLPEPTAIAILAVQEGEKARQFLEPIGQGKDGPARVAQEALEYLDKKKRGD